jgi:hypothetical protein
MPQATSPTTQLILLAPSKMPPTQDRTLELNLHEHKPTTLKEVSVDAYETRWK